MKLVTKTKLFDIILFYSISFQATKETNTNRKHKLNFELNNKHTRLHEHFFKMLINIY